MRVLMEEEGYIVLTYARDEDNNEMDYITIRRTHSVVQRGGEMEEGGHHAAERTTTLL